MLLIINIVRLDLVFSKIFLLCHLGQCWPKCREKTFEAKLDQDTQYFPIIIFSWIFYFTFNCYLFSNLYKILNLRPHMFFLIVKGLVSNIQLVAAILLVNVDFPDWTTNSIGKFAWINFHFPPPWDSSSYANDNNRKLLSIEEYAEHLKTSVEDLFPSNLFVFSVVAGIQLLQR